MTFGRLVWRGSDNGFSDYKWSGDFPCNAFAVVAHIPFYERWLLGAVFLWLEETSKPLPRHSLGHRSDRAILLRSTQLITPIVVKVRSVKKRLITVQIFRRFLTHFPILPQPEH